MSQNIFTGFHHYGIYCPDLDASVAFYRDALGFDFLNYFEDRDEHDYFKMAFMRLDKFLLEISQPADWGKNALEWATMGPNHFCLVCGDLEATKKKVEAVFDAGWIAFEDSPYYKSAFFRGPGNELIELMQVTDGSFPVVHTPNDCPFTQGLGHISYFCKDLDESIGFYADVMGFKLEKTYESCGSDLGVRHKAALLTLNDMMLELAQPIANPVVLDRLNCLAFLSMDHLGMIPDGDMQESMDLLRSRSDKIVWENTAPNITYNVMEGLNMQWALFRGPNGERWEYGKDA